MWGRANAGRVESGGENMESAEAFGETFGQDRNPNHHLDS